MPSNACKLDVKTCPGVWAYTAKNSKSAFNRNNDEAESQEIECLKIVRLYYR